MINVHLGAFKYAKKIDIYNFGKVQTIDIRLIFAPLDAGLRTEEQQHTGVGEAGDRLHVNPAQRPDRAPEQPGKDPSGGGRLGDPEGEGREPHQGETVSTEATIYIYIYSRVNAELYFDTPSPHDSVIDKDRYCYM